MNKKAILVFFIGFVVAFTYGMQKPETGQEPALITAAKANDLEGVKKLLQDPKTDVNARGIYQETALFWAATKKNEAMVRVLLARKADPNIQDADGGTALFIAIATQNEKIIQILLNQEANPNIQDNNGISPLMLAITLGSNHESCNKNIVKMLLEKKADTNLQDTHKVTTLMDAVYYCQDPEIVSLLLAHGAKRTINQKDSEENTALLIAVKKGKEEMAKLLLKGGADPNLKHALSGFTPLHNAVAEGSSEMVILLIDNGANLIVRDHNGQTPLGLAESLIEQGIDRKQIFGLLAKALEKRQKKYAQEWKERMRLRPF